MVAVGPDKRPQQSPAGIFLFLSPAKLKRRHDVR